MGKKQMQRRLAGALVLGCVLCFCGCGISEKDIKPDDRIINMSDLQEEIDFGTKQGIESGSAEIQKSEKSNPENQPKENQSVEPQKKTVDFLVKVKDKYYRDTGKISTVLRCGVMDGEITKAVDADEIPMEENQSNFGAGYGYQYSGKGRLDVNIDGEWHIFQEIPINTDVHSIQITNGTIGEVLELSREIQPEAFWEIMQKYESLDVKESENQTPWTGYSYRLQLLDEEGKELYSVYPKGQYIEINNIRYEDFEKTTTVELMLAVDACWKEDLPMGDLVETKRQELDVIEGFSMNVTYATCRGVSLQFTNQTDKNIMMGDSYSLQNYQDGKWYELDYLIDNWAFTAIGYEMPPESIRSLAVKWDVFHGELEPGHYRIVKDISDFRGTGDYTQYYVGAEFIIP
ncbi:MAG: hypothetical protein J6A94_12500 [Lachnospiraceae bacterium]|nr:hypothetical protein [Lachnospiraceae bacterium]